MSSVENKITEGFIQELLSRTDLAELIGGYIPLKKAGANFSGNCPFHNEKTPSFTVSPQKNFYHCFGCQKHGDAINFLEEYEGLSFIEALEKLAQRVGMEVPKSKQAKAVYAQRKEVYEILAKANKFFSRSLRQSSAKVCVDYLKRRGITGKTAKEFDLGFAPFGWDNLLTQFAGQEELLIKAGLLIKNDLGKLYDRFRGRVIFPIKDSKGRVIGFGGRVLDDSLPKYLNSPETEVFHKKQQLYGIYEYSLAKHTNKEVVLVEGYMDVVSLREHGITNALATLGTAITAEHITLLFNREFDLVFCFDGDKAGQKAALKAMELVLPLMQGLRQVKFMFLPQGQDPDSFIMQKGKQEFIIATEKAMPFSDFLFATVLGDNALASVDDKARFTAEAKEKLKQLPNSDYKDMLYSKLYNLVGMRKNKLNLREVQPKIKSLSPSLPPNLVALVAGYLLAKPELVAHIEEDSTFMQVEIKSMPVLAKIYDYIVSTNANAKQVAEYFAKDVMVQQMVQTNWRDLIPNEGYVAEFKDAVARIKEFCSRSRIKRLLDKSKKEKLSQAEQKELKQLLTESV